MRIQSKEITAQEGQEIAIALGEYLQLLDNQRNTRAATADEVREFVFGPLRKVVLDRRERIARQASPIEVTPIDV